MHISAHQKLRKAVDFKELRETGVRSNCGSFILVIKKHESGSSRFAIIASRKVGNAVKRNRAKRIFRELFRLNQHNLPSSCDFLIIVRSSFDNFSYDQIQARFLKASLSYGTNK